MSKTEEMECKGLGGHELKGVLWNTPGFRQVQTLPVSAPRLLSEVCLGTVVIFVFFGSFCLFSKCQVQELIAAEGTCPQRCQLYILDTPRAPTDSICLSSDVPLSQRGPLLCTCPSVPPWPSCVAPALPLPLLTLSGQEKTVGEHSTPLGL